MFIKENWKGIAIVFIASLIIAVSKANFKNSNSLAYSISSDIYRFAGVDAKGDKMTIASRVKKEADECLGGYAISTWTFEKEAQIYRNDTIYGCTGSAYGKENDCLEATNLKTVNNAYTGNYVLEEGWFEDLILKSSTKDAPKIYECDFEKNEKCPEIEKTEFFKFQIFCSIQGTMNPVKCEEIIDNFIRKPAYAQVEDDLVEIKRSTKEAREHYINQIVYTRNPIKNLKFVIIKEKDPRFLKAIMLSDMDNNNKNCDGNKGTLRLISFANSLQ
jgi:hypothetical protein